MQTSQRRRLAVALSIVVAGALSAGAVSNAVAGECPSDKVGTNALVNAPQAPTGVQEVELSSIDLANENVKLPQRRLRYRNMVIQPGGVVPLHDHADRPALILVNQGEIDENSSKCLVPIHHRPGDISREFAGTKHWWKNDGKQAVVLTIADIVNDRKPETMPQHM